jgi:hypothetical protein
MNLTNPLIKLLYANTSYNFTGLVFVFGMLLIACVEEYTPEIKGYSNLLVIDGSIKKGESFQYVYISRSSSIYESDRIPVSNCQVTVLDEVGNRFNFSETSEGEYKAFIPDEFLTIGNSYQLDIITESGARYQSGFETLLESSPIDSIYYAEESSLSQDNKVVNGLQFYTDLKAPESATKNYLWTVEETWEIHTFYDIEAYFVTEEDSIYDKPLDSLTVCWNSRRLRQYFVSNTANLLVNEKKKIPLSYISGESEKLNVKYSILVKQFALSDGAFDFWNKNFINTEDGGNLYEGQPAQSVTNIKNINNPEEKVLGYFWASTYSEKRLFFSGPLITIVRDCSHFRCVPVECNLIVALRGMGRDVVYMIKEQGDYAWPLRQICIDCRAEGGTLIKPDFWE